MNGSRNILVRGLYMLLMCIAYQISGTLIFVVSVVQFAIALLTGSPNEQLGAFGAGLGRYLQQVVSFLTFASERLPFPFDSWPSGER